MRVKTKDLAGLPLNWAVAMCEGYKVTVLTVEEQRERWVLCFGADKTREESVAEWEEHIGPTAKPKICISDDDGYKRSPAHSEALTLFNEGPPRFKFDTSFAQAGPIIERERITLRTNACVPGHWAAYIDFGGSSCAVKARQSGPTPLIAAMRCYCCAKLGGEIDIPQELQPCQQLNI